MKRHPWTPAIVAVVLIAGHGLVLYVLKSHMTLSAGVIGGVVLLVMIRHLGLFGPAYAILRRRFRRKA